MSGAGVGDDAYTDLGGVLNDLGIAKALAGDGEGAQKNISRTLYMAQRAYRPDEDLVSAACSNLAEVMRARGKQGEGGTGNLPRHQVEREPVSLEVCLGVLKTSRRASITVRPQVPQADETGLGLGRGELVLERGNVVDDVLPALVVKRHVLAIQMQVTEDSQAKVGCQAFFGLERLSPGRHEPSSSPSRSEPRLGSI